MREVWFYGVVGIIHGGAYFCGFIASEKLKYQARLKVIKVSAIKQPRPQTCLKIWWKDALKLRLTLKDYKVSFWCRTGILQKFRRYFFHLIFIGSSLDPNSKSTSQVWIQMSCFSLTLQNEFQKRLLLGSAFTNELWNVNFPENYQVFYKISAAKISVFKAIVLIKKIDYFSKSCFQY